MSPIINEPVRLSHRHTETASIMDVRDHDRFRLDDDFVASFAHKQPVWGPVGYVTYKRTYARPLGEGKSEEYWQTVARVINGVYTVQKWHCNRFGLPWKDSKAQRSAQEMFRLMWEMKFLPPGRGLWMMGTPYIEKYGSAALNNCGFVSTKDIDQNFSEPFMFLMDYSMLGVGIGGDTRGVGKVEIHKPIYGDDVHVVEDSREGWVEIARRTLDAYVHKDTLPLDVDYSLVRPAGAPIKGFGGTAAGPDPLKRLVNEIHRVLNKLVGKLITSEAIVDLFDLIGVCVVSGNVRRSAIIMYGDPKDKEFLDLKNPMVSKEEMLSHRWASNNSVLCTQGANYADPASISARAGEPGYLWLENARQFGRMGRPADYQDMLSMGTNPCGEQVLEDGELCCLCETFPSRHDNYDEYERTLKFSYLYAKTVTLIPTHSRKTNAVTLRNRRIGLSQSGIIQSFQKHGRRTHLKWCERGYDYITKLDEIYANWLCVPRSKRRTTVKPSGSVSLLPGVTPGIHYEHSEFYLRAIRCAKTSPLVAMHRNAGYKVEDDIYDQARNTSVIFFPIKAQHFDRAKKSVSMFEQLENAAQMQHSWSDNSVSITVTFQPDEAKDIAHALELYESRLKTVSFLPYSNDYEQAPYTEITEEEYKKAIKNLKPIDYSRVMNDTVEKFCESDVCMIPKR